MHRRHLLALLPLLLLGPCACDRGRPAPTRQEILGHSRGCNILVVLLDAAAAGHVGAYGYSRPTTPRIDALADESILFEQAQAQATGTALSVYSLFTSRYPALERVPRPSSDENAVFLSEDLFTLPEALAPVLSHRLLVSTNPFVTAQLGYGQGATHMIEDWKPGPEARAGLPPRYADRVTPPALRWIAERGSESWFAYLHYLEPHAPYMPPEPYRSRLKRHEAPLGTGDLPFLHNLGSMPPPLEMRETIVDLYDGNLAYVDAEVGALVDSLRASGQWERTVFVLLADHGEGFWEHGRKGHGGPPHQELTHVPLLLRIPGLPELEGRRISTPVELVDLMPTLLELAGIDTAGKGLVGNSWLPLLAGERRDDPFPADRVLHMRSNRMNRPVYALRRGGYKWLLHVRPERQELYDLRQDPGEGHDLLARGGELPEEIADFPDLLRGWLSSGQGPAGTQVDVRGLDEDMLESLRSLGYVE